MKLDLGSFAFGSSVSTGGNTPSWGTSLGQKKPDLKFTYPGYDNILIGMMYKSIPVDKVYTPLGKGGRVYNSLGDEGIQLAALFDIVYVNEVRVNAPFIMLIYQDSSDTWAGRRTLKYNPKTEYRKSESEIISNSAFVGATKEALQLDDEACWVISDIYVVNQEELHMVAGIVNPHESQVYTTAELRKVAFLEAINTTFDENPHFKTKYSSENINRKPYSHPLVNEPLQQIFYGAPGTGKSFFVDEMCKSYKHIRTTFHPDSDYSTFVGCYKPESHRTESVYTKSQLIDKLSTIKNTGVTYPCHKFAAKYWESLKDLTTSDIKDILTACEFTESMNVEVSKGIAIGEDLSKTNQQTTISYEFVPQAFTNAYIEAWKNQKGPVFLVIEEINRGNCAQIFGDLFQLLDRDDETNCSNYEITPDTDLQDYISKQGLNISGIYDSNNNDISADIASGKLMKLPSNLYIWATMNTSDQSLFPIDSAFKRRWDWKYIKISNAYELEKDTNGNIIFDDKHNPKKKLDAGNQPIKKDWKIAVKDKDENNRDWWAFLEQINKIIANMTNSADKQLGYFFCKADSSKVISVEKFVSKVLFYLWNDVFKDYGFDDAKLFKYTYKKEDKDIKADLTFPDFYDEDGDVKEDVVKQFVDHVMDWKPGNQKSESEE